LKEEIAEVALWNSLKEGKLISLEEYLDKLKIKNEKLKEKSKS
jgi:hypothetical protein